MVRILHIDDNETDRLLVRRELSRLLPDLQTHEVRDQREFDLALDAGQFDLAITDYQLGWSTGLVVLNAVKGRYPDRPVVMFTGTGNEEVAVEAMKAGLDDYVVKSPRHAIRLVTAVRSALEKAEARRRAADAERERADLFRREQAARAEAERLLREVGAERGRLEDLFGLAPSLLCVLRGPDHVFERASDRYLDLVGRRNIIGRPVREAVPELAAQGYVELLDRVYRAGEPFAGTDMPARLHRRPGEPPEERFFDFVYQPLRDAGGAVTGILAQGVEVTARHRAEEELRRKQAELTDFVENATVGLHWVGPDGTVLWANQAELDLLGYVREEYVGRNIAEFHADPSVIDDILCRLTRGEELHSYEARLRCRDGSVRHVLISSSVYREGGAFHHTRCFTRDITDRKRVEQALRESEERFRLLAETIPQLAWVARPDGHIDWYNRRWYEYTGTTPDQMEGWGWQSVHDPEELPKVLERWQASLATGEPFDMVFPIKGHDSVFRPFLTRVVPLRGEDGRILQWFGTNTDISELREMQARLEEADRRKDQWVMMLAHELRNPLAPIRNSLQVLEAPGADASTSEQARRVMARQVGHMARIIDDLLDVSRLLRGRVELRPERTDLGRLARTVVGDGRAAFDKAGVTLEADLPELPAWVNADPTRLTQVVANLLHNAAKFTDRGGTVSVRVRADAGRRQAVLVVRDTGVGIEPGLLPHLFETFTQADRSLDRGKGGLGLGLSLVKGLVELHGGTVEARSDGLGRGAEFVIRLPLQPEPAAVTGMPTAPKPAARRLRVLVVEDNRDAADSLVMLLEVFGYDVNVAYCGPSGVAAAAAWGPDAVVCDIGLPGLDGYGVARELRRHPATATARLIAVTGYGGDEDRRRSQEAGFDGHLTKPADPSALQELLAKTGLTA